MTKALYESDYSSQGYEYVDFDDQYVIASTNDKEGLPITQVKLEIERPCQDAFTQSGLILTDDNQIYNFYEFGYMDQDDGAG